MRNNACCRIKHQHQLQPSVDPVAAGLVVAVRDSLVLTALAVAFVGAQTCKGTTHALVAVTSIRAQAMPLRPLLTVPKPDPPKFTQLS